MSSHFEESLMEPVNNRINEQTKADIESEKKVQRIVKRAEFVSKKKKQSTNLMTLFKSMNLSLKRKNYSSISFFLSMEILNIIFQNVESK